MELAQPCFAEMVDKTWTVGVEVVVVEPSASDEMEERTVTVSLPGNVDEPSDFVSRDTFVVGAVSAAERTDAVDLSLNESVLYGPCPLERGSGDAERVVTAAAEADGVRILRCRYAKSFEVSQVAGGRRLEV